MSRRGKQGQTLVEVATSATPAAQASDQAPGNVCGEVGAEATGQGYAVAVTRADLDACIARHTTALVNAIRDPQCPSDGAVLTIIQTLDRLSGIVPTKEAPA